MALGARKGNILALVLTRGMLLSGIGTVAGILLALILTQLMTHLFFDIGGTAATTTYLGAALFLLAAAFGACMLPAYGAASIQPTSAMRQE